MATVKNETVMKRQPATRTGRLHFLDQFRGFALLVIISNLWMLWFQYGPLEWLWRCGTYWALVPIRKKTGNPQA